MSKRRFLRAFRFAVFALLLLAGAERGAGYDLTFSLGQPGIADHLESDGSAIPTYAGYRFELGTFGDTSSGTPFVPLASNADEWMVHWMPMKAADGDPVLAANAEYGVVDTLFDSYKGFTSTFDHNHSAAPFVPGKQMYVWGYDQRDTPASAQWVLLSNASEWRLNDGTDGLAFAQIYEAGDATQAILGSVMGGMIQLGTIGDPGPQLPALSVADAQVAEGGGVVSVVLSLSESSASDVVVDCYSANGSALGGADFTTFDGPVTIPAGQTVVAIQIAIQDDAGAEIDETFNVVLSDPSGATIADGSATVTIYDDDALEQLSSSGAELLLDRASGALSVTWPAVAGREYAVLSSHDLIDWQLVDGGEVVVASSENGQFVLSNPAERCFYKILDLAPPAP